MHSSVIVAVVLLVAGPGCPEMAPAAASPVARPRIAITHVTLIDPRSGPQPDVTIVLDGDRIAEVGPSAMTPVPAGASVHDGTGSFAIPGLWDAHVHVSQIGDGAMRLLVANGVTSVRDMGSAFADVAHWRTVRCAGGPAPRVYSPGPKLDGRGDEQVDSWLVSSPEDARRAVARLKAIGVDFIKVHYGLSRPVYDAIMAESRRVGLTVAGHILDEIPAQAAAAAGQRTIEHGRGMLPCSAQLRSRIRAEPEPAPLAGMCEPEAQAEPIEPMLAALARAGTWLTPTLASWRGRTLDRAAIAKLDGIRYASAALEERWGDPESPGPVERELLNSFGPLAAAAHRAGVALLAGTDAGDPFVVPGFALHDELALLVAAGVPPLVALRSATFEPARALGVADTVGSIARAQAADIVLLGADPLADIHNTRRIVAVVVNGRWFTADQLAALIAPLRRAS